MPSALQGSAGVAGPAGATGPAGSSAPSGAILSYAGASAPTGWLLCDGASYLRTDYPDLFTALGGTGSPWGLPDGTHFNVPDLRGRVAVGLGTHADVDALGDNDGSALASRRPAHKHTVATDNAVGGGGSGAAGTNSAGNQHNAAITVGPQTASPTDAPAYVVVLKIIKT